MIGALDSARRMNIAIIPARGGSKRIPRKNIRHFAGRPIISYSIECGLFERVIVSTDDVEISKVANPAVARSGYRHGRRLGARRAIGGSIESPMTQVGSYTA